jgi:hypothetical protein
MSAPHHCKDLGVCQAHAPACADCPERCRIALPGRTVRTTSGDAPAPLRLAPGVIEGPYRHEGAVTIRFKQGAEALSPLAAWLMGPRP